jgi:formyltetrahydrofolate deformylase
MSSAAANPARGAAHTARLLISCPDGPGIVAAVSRFLFERGANIVTSDQYSTHPVDGTFFMRLAYYLPVLDDHRE